MAHITYSPNAVYYDILVVLNTSVGGGGKLGGSILGGEHSRTEDSRPACWRGLRGRRRTHVYNSRRLVFRV